MQRSFFLLIVAFLSMNESFAKTYSNTTFTDNGPQKSQSSGTNKKSYGKWTIVLHDSSMLSERIIDSLAEEYFIISPDSGKQMILYAEVIHLTKINEHSTIMGIISGMVIGFLIGSSWETDEKDYNNVTPEGKGFASATVSAGNAFIGTMIGANLFGIIGAILDIDKEYDVATTPNESKPTVIRNILQGKK